MAYRFATRGRRRRHLRHTACASLEAIAEEAGFSKGVVYSQFAGKADLFLALLDQRIEQRAKENERVADGLAGPDAVRALLSAAYHDAQAEPGWPMLLVEFRAHAVREPDVNARYAQAHARTIDRLSAVLASVHAQIEARGDRQLPPADRSARRRRRHQPRAGSHDPQLRPPSTRTATTCSSSN